MRAALSAAKAGIPMDDTEAAAPPLSPPRTSASIPTLAGALWRRKLWILVPTVIAFLASLGAVNLLTPRYTGEARVLLENRDTVYSRPDRDAGLAPASIDPEAVASQVQNVMSKDLALQIIHEMGLARRAEYDPVQKGLGVSGMVLVLAGLLPDPRKVPQEERVLDSYYKRLLAYPLGKSRVIAIEFQSEDPKVAADVANRIAEEYLRREEGAKNQTNRATSDWLDKAIEPLMQKVVAAEAKVEVFRAAKGLFVGSNNTSISSQQLAELNTQLSSARAQQADLAARAKVIREALRLGKVFETSEVINNELVRRLLEQRAALKAQIAFEERTLLPGHPRMKELAGQLGDLENQVRAAAERAARAFDNDARAAGARVASMQAELDSQKKTTALSNEDEVQLKALEREAVALREQLNSYRNKFLDAAARASENAQPADARIISRAFPQSEPTFPKKIPIVLLATLGTLVVTASLIAAQVLMARQALPDMLGEGADFAFAAPGPAVPPAMRAARPVEAPAGSPADAAAPLPWERNAESLADRLRAAIPFGRKKTDRPASEPFPAPARYPFPEFAEAAPTPAFGAQGSGGSAFTPPAAPAPVPGPIEDLVRELAAMDFNGQGKVLIVFGLEREARAGLTALRIGRRLAADGACLILDLLGPPQGGRGANLYQRLIAPGAPGLSAYLDRVASFGDIIHRDARSGLHVLPAGAALHHRVVAARTREELATLVEALRHAYSHVVIDAGTIGGAGEFFAEAGDVLVLVTRGMEDDPFLARTIERLEGLRDAPVYALPDDATAEFVAANDGFPAPGVGSA